MRSDSGDGRSAARMILALVLVVLVATGCGVPGSGEAEELENAPGVGGPAPLAGNVELPEPSRDISNSDLVMRYLMSGAAADWFPDLGKEERIPAAIAQAHKFLTREARQVWKAGSSVDVIEVLDTTAELDSVKVIVRRVGVLDGDGVLTPHPGESVTEQLEFRIDTSLMLLSSVPNGLPLSLAGLQSLFEVRPVYYWDPTKQFLVPDRRYLSRRVSPEKRVVTIVERVLGAPSAFLRQAVEDPPVTASRGNAELHGTNVVVNLPVTAETDQEPVLRRLATQIRWSLHPARYSVELQVGGRDGQTYSGTDYLRDNPSRPRTGDGNNEPRLFGSVNGKVAPLEPGVSAPSILSRPENADVIAAAVNVQQNTAALVRRVGGPSAPKQLWVGRTPADQQSAPQFRQAVFPGPIGTFSRPTYLPGSAGRVLIVADGTLYDVDLGTGEAVKVTVPQLPSPPVAVSVAPDGARIAIVTSSKAYVATIDPSKTPATINTSAPQPAREIHVNNLANLQSVGWYYEDRIIVGGRSGLMIAAVDGGQLEQTGPANLQSTTLTQLSAAPRDPSNASTGNVVIEADTGNGTLQAFFPFTSGMRPVTAPETGPTPAPSASGGTAPPPPRVTAAFYADVV